VNPLGPRNIGRRGYEAAELTRLTEDFKRTPVAPNQDVRSAFSALVARSRELYQNSSHVKGFVHFRLPSNVLGADGIQISPQIRRTRGGEGALNGLANRRIRDSWRAWSRRGECTMDGESSFADVQKQILEAIVRDGEVLVQHVRGRRAGNAWNYRLHVLEAEHLDVTYDSRAGPDARVIMGVEIDQWRRRRGYWVQTENPYDLSFTFLNYQRTRVEADDMIHPFVKMYPSQLRGISWLHAGASDGNMLAKYREAELVAARAAASKAYAYVPKDEISTPLQGVKQVVGEDGRPQYVIEEEVEPGQVLQAPPGYDITSLDPTHPSGNFSDFEKAVLRGMAAGLGASYHGFSGDLEAVNYSAARAGAIDEREVWRTLQRWFTQHVLEPIFEAWLDMAMLGSELRLPPQIRPQILEGVKWRPRGFQWIDPAKESSATATELESKLTSRRRVLAARGEDFEELVAELVEERALLEAAGMSDNVQAQPGQNLGDDDQDENQDATDENADADGDDSDADVSSVRRPRGRRRGRRGRGR
jgi:lambda family phage portal protein